MTRHPMNPRRLAAVALVLAAALGVVSCGREVNRLTPPPTGTATWDNTISHLLADRSEGTQPTGCTSCHHAGTNLPDWSDYDTVVGYSSILRSELDTFGTMRQFLKDGEADVVIGWIDAGMPRR